MTSQSWLPGAGDLGRCIDIFGPYEVTSQGIPLFDLKDGGSSWDWNGTTYDLPTNVAIPQRISAGTATARTYSSKSSFAQSLAANAKINGSYGGFEGEASLHFSGSSDVDTSVTFATLTVNYDSYQITLQHATESELSQSIKDDDDYKNIPDQFDPADVANINLFAQFFSKYGTHFIDSVTCGAQLTLYSWSENSKIKSQTEIDAALKASYSGLFVKVGAEADVAWKSVSQSEFDDLHMEVVVKGGDTSILAVAQPSHGANYNKEFRSWLKTVNAQPVPRDFTVAEISLLFSGKKRQAVHQAARYFSGMSLRIHTDPMSMTASVGTPTWAAISDGPFRTTNAAGHPQTGRLGGMFVVVLDRTTLERKFARTYDVSKDRKDIDAMADGANWATLIYDPILTGDLAPYTNDPNVIIVVAFPACSTLYSYPSAKFAGFLRGLTLGPAGGGGGAEIDRLANHETSSTMTGFAYVLAGVPQNPAMGVETIVFRSDKSGAPSQIPQINRGIHLLPRFHGSRVGYDLFGG